MTMPVMEPDLDAEVLRDWAQEIDDGPFSSLCWGERMAFDNPETLTLLGALAAWTDRVRLVTTVMVPQLHDPVMLAKALATGDMLSGGRLTVGLGIGRFAYSLVLPDMRDSLGWSYSAAGFMNTINAAGYLAGALVASKLIKRFGLSAAVRWGTLACVASPDAPLTGRPR